MATTHTTLIKRVHNLERALGWKASPKSNFSGWDFTKFIKAIRRLEHTLLNQQEIN